MKNMPSEKAKGPTVAAVSPLKTGQSGRKFSPKSTHSEAQRQRILEALRRRPQTTVDLRRIGCFQAPARVLELRRQGYLISTERIALYDEDGFLHPRAARYHLDGEPA